MKREQEGLTKGQARYLVQKIQKGRKRSAWTVRAADGSYVVYSDKALTCGRAA